MRTYRQQPLAFIAVQLPDGDRFWAVGHLRTISIDRDLDEFWTQYGPRHVVNGESLTVTLDNPRWHTGERPPDSSLDDLAQLPGTALDQLPPALRQIGSGS